MRRPRPSVLLFSLEGHRRRRRRCRNKSSLGQSAKEVEGEEGERKRRKDGERERGELQIFSYDRSSPLLLAFPSFPSLHFPPLLRVINTPFFLPPHSGCPSRTSPRPSFPDISLSLSLTLAGYLVLTAAMPESAQLSRVESTESLDRRLDNRAEVAVTAAANGESSVKNLFLPLHFSAVSADSQNQWCNLT